MEIINLPGDIIKQNGLKDEPIVMYEYAAHKRTFKGRSVLSKNAISLVIKGEKTMHFAEKTVHANAESFHFLSLGNCLASVNLLNGEEFKSLLVFYDDDIMQSFLLKHSDRVNKLKAAHKVQTEAYVSIEKDDFIRNYILSVLLMKPESMSMSMKLLKFEELMLYLLEKYPLTVLALKTGTNTDFDDTAFKLVIETNITNNLSMEDLAFLCNTSLSTFKRRFSKIYNTTPSKWITKRRMEIAAVLLEYRREKPSDVYHKVGYENHSSFSQSFKEYYGISPKEYQQKSLNV